MQLSPFKSLAALSLLLGIAAVCFVIKRDSRFPTTTFSPAVALPKEGKLVHQAGDRETILSLPYVEFDQTKGSGWRPFYDERRQCREVADLIEAYLPRHAELTPVQRATLHFHAAQMYAGEGMNAEALTHLEHARVAALGPGWDAMVTATRAFLMHDHDALVAARRGLKSDSDDYAEELDTLIECFGESYADMRWWAPLSKTVALAPSSSRAVRAAAEKLGRTFGLSLVEASAKPDHCIWLEMHAWDARPGWPWDGYMILHYRSGTVITASNPHWLDAAVERLVQSSRERNGKREAPTGLMTSFSLAR